MKAALFASAFHPHVGGVEEVTRQLAHRQRLAGDSPLIVTNLWPKDLPEAEEFEGLPIRRYNFRVPERHWKQWGGAWLYGPGTLRRLCSDLKTHGADLIHVHCVSSNAYYALRARKRLGLPLVVTLHSELTMDATGLFQRSAFAQSLLRTILAEADAITGVSAKTLADAEAFWGKPFGTRARVIYNGVPLEEFAACATYRHEKPYILAIGRLVTQKGFDILLRAFAEADLRDYDLLIAGDGAEREALEGLAACLGQERSVHFLGRSDRAQTLALFKGCEYVVVPSRTDEGLPMVTMESIAAGKPVIASQVGGIPESISDGVNGLLVPKEDVAALSEALQKLAHDTKFRERLGSGAKERAEAFAWSDIAAQYAEVYAKVSQRRGTQP
ncbi:MAG TPA: glycosyltransferase family 4 protein [Chthonomonadaceae bacterium]|nr:glycosyltransferase family 4 protein [Chthonomonadaceae bacterium]